MKTCYLCGKPADTNDHVPPKGFFPKPWPDNLLTVPACFKCNNGLSGLDEKMRVLFSSDEHANDMAKLIGKQKVFTENSAKGRGFRTVAATLKSFPVKVGEVITMGHSLSAPTDEVYSFVERVVRGLVYKFYSDIHDPKAFVMVECISTVAFKEARNAQASEETMKQLTAFAARMNRVCFGNGVLDVLHQRADDCGSGWIISFYGGATFFAVHSTKPSPPDKNAA